MTAPCLVTGSVPPPGWEPPVPELLAGFGGRPVPGPCSRILCPVSRHSAFLPSRPPRAPRVGAAGGLWEPGVGLGGTLLFTCRVP